MLVNVSYNNKKVQNTIDEAVGKPFTLKQRIKMRGIGMGRLTITEASVHINNLLILDNNRNLCNIELRPNGIIVGFRSLLESYALVIPYYKLSLYKGEADIYSIYRDQYYVKIRVDEWDRSIHKFMRKVMALKAENSPGTPYD